MVAGNRVLLVSGSIRQNKPTITLTLAKMKYGNAGLLFLP